MSVGSYRKVRQQSRRTALCGLLTALGVVLLSLGGWIPLASIALPMLAMLCLIPAVRDYGARTALVQYAATAALGVLLCADQEASLLYVFLGWYPALRPRLEKLPKALRAAVKAGIYCIATALMYAALLLFRMEAVIEEFAGYSAVMLTALLLLGCLTFLVFDRAIGTLSAVYGRRRRR